MGKGSAWKEGRAPEKEEREGKRRRKAVGRELCERRVRVCGIKKIKLLPLSI